MNQYEKYMEDLAEYHIYEAECLAKDQEGRTKEGIKESESLIVYHLTIATFYYAAAGYGA